MLNFTLSLLIVIFCFLCLPGTLAQSTAEYEMGEGCYGEGCLNIDSLLTLLQTIETPLTISVKGILYLPESLIFRNRVAFIGPGEIVYINKKKNHFIANITIYSDFVAENINFQVPVYLYGKKKQQLIEEGSTVDQITPDYKCYGNTLGKFDYYSNSVIITNCVFSSDTASSMLTFGSNTEKTFFNSVSIKNSLFNFTNYNYLEQGIYDTAALVNIAPTILIEEKSLLNTLLIEKTRFFGAKIRCNGYYIKLQEYTNYWYPLLFRYDDTQQPVKFHAYPLIQTRELPEEVKALINDSLRVVGQCKGFYSLINQVTPKGYFFTEQGVIDPTINGKNVCVICVEVLRLEGCSVVYNSVDALIEYQNLQQDHYFSDNELFTIKPLDTILIQGECKSCDFQSIALTISSRDVVEKSLLYCDTPGSESILNFKVTSNSSDVASILVESLYIFDRPIQSDYYTGSIGGISINFAIPSPQNNVCIAVNISDNIFRGLGKPISIRAPHHCSSVTIENNYFVNSKLTLEYSNNIYLNSTFTNENPSTEGSFLFSNNNVLRSGEMSFLDIYNKKGNSITDNTNNKKRSNVIHSSRSVINPKITPDRVFYEKMEPQKLNLPLTIATKSSSLEKVNKNKESTLVNKNTSINGKSVVVNDFVHPGFPINFKIENNQFNVTDRFFYCSGVNGISFISNNINWEADTKKVSFSSLCDEIYFASNNLTGAEKPNSALLKFAGLVQIFSRNNINGRFKFLLEAGGYDDVQGAYKKNTGSSLVFSNFFKNGAVLEVPESLQSPVNFIDTPPSQNASICNDLCPSNFFECNTCISGSKNFYEIMWCLNNPICSFSVTAQSSINCLSCILKRYTTGSLELPGNKVLFMYNLLEGCDFSNILFKRASQGQCAQITSDYFFLGYNFISQTCPNHLNTMGSLDDHSYFPIITFLSDTKKYFDEKGSIKTCSADKHRLDLLNPPKCCVKFTVNDTSTSNSLQKKSTLLDNHIPLQKKNVLPDNKSLIQKTLKKNGNRKRDFVRFRKTKQTVSKSKVKKQKEQIKQKKQIKQKGRFKFLNELLEKYRLEPEVKQEKSETQKEDRLKSVFEKISRNTLEKKKYLKK